MKYGGLQFHDEDGAQQGFDGLVNGFTLEDSCCVLVWKMILMNNQ